MEKQRRSSIRNPNNLRTNTTDNLNEAGRASRRVSFSSRNRVKPFIKGSETTIWDLSYEEAIHSTQSSQEITNKSLEKSSPNIENNSVDSIEQNQIEEEESTDSDHANQTLLNIESLSMEIEEIDRPTQIHTRQIMVAIDKENLPIMINREFDMEMTCQKEQTICQSINKMEITCQDTMKNPNISDMEFTCQMKNLTSNLVVKSMSDKTDMEITCQQIKSDQFEAEKENLHFSTNDMEFTCQLPAITTSSLNKTKMYLTCQQPEKIESQIELNQTDMEFTCRLPNYSVKSVQNKSVMELTCQQSEKVESEIGLDKSDMEFTCRLPNSTALKSVMELTCQEEKIKESQIELNQTDMEFTCKLPNYTASDALKSMENKTKIELTCEQTEKVESEIGSDKSDMEFTCRLPNSTALKSVMEFTCQEEKIKESQIELNQTDMEFTCKLPNYTTNEALKSMENKTEMELTCQKTEKLESEIGSDKSEMEFTCRLPNSTALKSVMELSCQEEKIMESQIELNQTDMEFTCKLPNYTTNEALKSMENKTEMELTCQKTEKLESEIGFKSDMEFTCKLPNSTTLKSVMELTCQQQQEKIGINKTDMEFTYRLPSSSINKSLKSIANKTEMELTCLQSEKVAPEIRSDETEMELTCRLTNSTISAPLKSLVNKTEMELTCQQPEKLDESAIGLGKTDMEFTCQLPNSTMNPSLKSIPNKSEIEPTYQQVERVDETCQQNTINKTTNRTSNRRQTIFLVKHSEDNSNIQTDDSLSNTMKISNAIKELDSSPISNNTDQQIKNIDADQCEIKASELSQIKDVDQAFNVDKKQQLGGKHERAKDMKSTCLSPLSSTIKPQTLNNLEVTKTKNSSLKAEESVMEPSAIDVELSRLSNSVLETNVEKLHEDSDVLVVENLANLTEPKLLEIKNEVLEQQQISLDGDVEEMEWSSITPRKSIRKSTIQENINENQVEIDRARKRSLLSSFIPLDSPQIIKKPTLNENQIQKSSMNLSTKFITPDKNKKKSHIPTPISSGKSKLKKLTQPDEHLDFLPIETTTPKQAINQNKKVLYSQKIDKHFKKLDSTYIKTPDRSGVRIMSPCIDDTQQLIDATVNLPERSINKPNKTPEIAITLPSIVKEVSAIEITLPSTSGIQLNLDDNENINDTAASLMENRLFQNINNTFVLNKLSNRKYQNQDDEENVYIDDCSIELVTSPDITKTTINNYDISDDYDFPLTRKFLEDFQLKQVSNELVQSPIIDIQKKQKIIDDFIDNFEFPRIKIPSVEDIGRLIENLRIKYDQKLENISIIEISDSEHHVMVLEEKIRALGKEREECIWKLAAIDNNLYKFNIVYSTLILTVELNPDNEAVSNFAIDIDTREKTNLLIYIHKAIKHKLNVSNVQSSLGQSYDLIAFLQYIEMVIEKFLTFIKEFTIYSFYDTSFDENCWLNFKIRNAAKLKFFIISVNMVNFENLTDDDIKVTLKFGDCDERKLKKIVKKCSKLPRFLRNSIKTIEAYCV